MFLTSLLEQQIGALTAGGCLLHPYSAAPWEGESILARAVSGIPWDKQQPHAQGWKGAAPQRQTEMTETQGEAAAGLPVAVGHYKHI